MNINIRLMAVALIIGISACNTSVEEKKCPQKPLTEFFLSKINLAESFTGPKAEFLEGSEYSFQHDFLEAILEFTNDTTFKFEDPFQEILENDGPIYLTKDQLDRKLIRTDTVYVEDPDPPHALSMSVLRDTMELESFTQLRTLEAWFVDEQFRLSKEVKEYTLVKDNIDPITGEVRGTEPLFTIECKGASKGEKVASVRYLQRIDKLWDKSLWYVEHLEYSSRSKFLHFLLAKTLEGEFKVYGSPKAEAATLSAEKVEDIMVQVDTIFVENPAPPYDLKQIVVKETPEWDAVIGLEVIEDIYFAKDGSISIDVLWYAPVVDNIDPMTGEKMGTKTLFWVKCK